MPMPECVGELAGTRARVVRHGIHDAFGESGTPEALYAKFELDAAGIVKRVKAARG